jgi:hypothetical protein
MSNDSRAAYETWDMTAPAVPPRSRLFHINPVGFGTWLVECLTVISHKLPGLTMFLPVLFIITK